MRGSIGRSLAAIALQILLAGHATAQSPTTSQSNAPLAAKVTGFSKQSFECRQIAADGKRLDQSTCRDSDFQLPQAIESGRLPRVHLASKSGGYYEIRRSLVVVAETIICDPTMVQVAGAVTSDNGTNAAAARDNRCTVSH